MNPIGFDPATHTGYAYRTATGWRTGVLCPMNTAELTAVVRSAAAAGCDVAVLEDCYLDKNLKRNPRTLKKLQECQTRIVVVCEFFKVPVVKVAAVTWQSWWGIGGKRPERKAKAMWIAKTLHDKPITQDEADAICIAEGYRSMHKDYVPALKVKKPLDNRRKVC